MNDARRNQLAKWCREQLSQEDRNYILDNYRTMTDLTISTNLQKPLDIITTFTTVFGCTRRGNVHRLNQQTKGKLPPSDRAIARGEALPPPKPTGTNSGWVVRKQLDDEDA